MVNYFLTWKTSGISTDFQFLSSSPPMCLVVPNLALLHYRLPCLPWVHGLQKYDQRWWMSLAQEGVASRQLENPILLKMVGIPTQTYLSSQEVIGLFPSPQYFLPQQWPWRLSKRPLMVHTRDAPPLAGLPHPRLGRESQLSLCQLQCSKTNVDGLPRCLTLRLPQSFCFQ